jgi:hypothetical protein
MIFNLIAFLKADALINKLSGRFTRLLLTRDPEIKIVYDEINQNFYSSKIDLDDKSKIKINRDGDFYTFKTEESYICNKNNILRTCKKPSLFSFELHPLGYRITHKNKCLTGNDIALFKNCSENDRNQVFVFDLDTKVFCSEGFNRRQSNDPTSLIEKELPYAEKKKIMENEFKKLKIKNPETKKILEKAWMTSKYNWPRFNWC